MAAASQAVPRWKSLLDAALAKYPKQNVIQIATIDAQPHPDTTPQPRVRSHIFRAFLDSLPDGVGLPSPIPRPSASSTITERIESVASHLLTATLGGGKGSTGPTLPLLLSTTDIRTPKVTQLIANNKVELAWWIDGTKQQFRVLGRVGLVPSPSFTDKGTSDKSSEFWEEERVKSFKSMSVHMRAVWLRPAPGSPLSEHGGHGAAKRWPKSVEEPGKDDSEEEKRRKQADWDEALRNFALVVVEPLEVDFVDMGVVPNVRWRFWKEGEGWREEELVP